MKPTQLFLAVALISGNVAAAQVSYRTLVMSGQPAPGLASGVVISGITTFAQTRFKLDSSGAVGFGAVLSGTGVTAATDVAIYRDNNASGTTLIAREGDQVTGLPNGAVYSQLTSGTLGLGNGELGFTSSLFGTSVTSANNQAIFSEGGGLGLRLVARRGDHADYLSAIESLNNLFLIDINSVGNTLFFATINGATAFNDSALIIDNGVNHQLVAREGDPAPVSPSGVTYASISSEALGFNALSQVAFNANLTGTGVDSTNSRGIFSNVGGGAIASIARSGDQAPGLPANIFYQTPLSPIINNSGQMVYGSTLTGSSVDTTNSTALFRRSSGGVTEPIARTGDQASGFEPGSVYISLGLPRLNDNGDAVFVAHVTGPGYDDLNNGAIFVSPSESETSTLIREGDPAPGYPAGANYWFNQSPTTWTNDNGQVAFMVDVIGTGITSGNDRALYATDTAGVVRLVAAEGQLFDIDPEPMVEDLRTISVVVAGGGFSDDGDLLFYARFTDNSEGVFVARITSPIPGDYNADGVVDAADYTVWRDTLHSTTLLAADGDGNGQVDQGDFAVWSQNYGRGHDQSSNAVPEPCAVVMVLTAGLLSTRRAYHGVLTRIPR